MKASDILSLLRQKHAEDVFVDEVNDGPAYNRKVSRIDGWAMEKSWANPRIVGYEIKVTRQDFVRDTKWTAYLPMCHELYFVAPAGIIEVNEVPEAAGLMLVSKGGVRLVTKKKAMYREIKPPVSVFLYLLMSRALIGPEVGGRSQSREQRIALWRHWLTNKAEGKETGMAVATALGRKMLEVERENRDLKARVARIEEVEARLKELGYPSYTNAYHVDQTARRLAELKTAVPRELLDAVARLTGSLGVFQEQLQKIEKV